MKTNDKKERLVSAASELFHRQGVISTTLANISERAEVALGNVYYYFKSKDAITHAVIDMRKQQLITQLASYNEITLPQARLLKFMANYFADPDVIVAHGDPLSYLLQELSNNNNSDLISNANDLLDTAITWCRDQFVQLGKTTAAAKILAMHLVANVKSIGLLALTQKDSTVIEEQLELLGDWLDSL